MICDNNTHFYTNQEFFSRHLVTCTIAVRTYVPDTSYRSRLFIN